MYKKLLFIVLFIFPLYTFSQVTFTESKPYKTYTGNFLLYFQSGNEMLGFKRDGDVFILQKYDLKTLVQTGINTYKDMPDEYEIESVRAFNKRYYFFYSIVDKGKKTATLYCREINFNTGAFISPGNVFITVQSELRGSFYIYNSLNDEKLMVRYTLLKTHMNDDVNHQTLGFHVYDKNLKPVWKTESELPYAEKYIQKLSQAVDSNGDVYYLIRLYDKETSDLYGKDSEKAEHKLEMLKIGKETKKYKSSKVELPSGALLDINLVETATNEMVCVGLYNQKSDRIPSFFVSKINKDGSMGRERSYDIPVSITSLYEDKRDKTIRPDKEIPNLAELNHLGCTVIKKDTITGDLFIVAECINEEYVDEYLLSHYDDLIALRIDVQGQMKWMQRLPKRPFTHGSAYSFTLISKAKNDYIVFLDHEENKNLKINEITAKRLKSKETVLTAYKINKASGHTEKIILLDSKLVNGKQIYRITSERVLEASDTELIFEAYKKDNEDVLIKIKGVE